MTTTNTNKVPQDDQYDLWASQERVQDKYDYTFYAVYYVHKYAIHYMDGDGTELITAYVPANGSIVAYTPLALPTREIADTKENFKFVEKFDKWATMNASGELTPVEWTEANIGRANRDRTFYPTFTQVSVYDNVLDDKYLNCTDIGDGYVLMSFAVTNLKGKITLPKRCKGLTPTMFISENKNPELTHIFFEEGSSVTQFGDNCFSDSQRTSKLIYVEIPNNNFIIGGSCFSGCSKLFTSSWMGNNELVDFFKHITSIESNAFMGLRSTNPDTAVLSTCGGLYNKDVTIYGGTYIGLSAFGQNYLKSITFGHVGDPASLSDFNTPGKANQACLRQIATINGTTPIVTVYYDHNSVMDEGQKRAWAIKLFYNEDLFEQIQFISDEETQEG